MIFVGKWSHRSMVGRWLVTLGIGVRFPLGPPKEIYMSFDFDFIQNCPICNNRIYPHPIIQECLTCKYWYCSDTYCELKSGRMYLGVLSKNPKESIEICKGSFNDCILIFKRLLNLKAFL